MHPVVQMQLPHALYRSSPAECIVEQFCEHVLVVHASRHVLSAAQSAFALHAFAADAQAPPPVDALPTQDSHELAPEHVPLLQVSPLAHA